MKALLRLESDGRFPNSKLVIVATGDSLPVAEVSIDIDTHGVWTRLRIPPGCIAFELDPDKPERERQEYERLQKIYGRKG